jgi:hypothetical protein
VSRKKAELLGSMLPLPLQFLAAWLAMWFARALQWQVDYLMADGMANPACREINGTSAMPATNLVFPQGSDGRDADQFRPVLG